VRLIPSIGPWLPWIKGILPYSVLLGTSAAELYFFSILGKPSPEFQQKRIFFGVPKAGPSMQAFHEHLLSQGFKRHLEASATGKRIGYFREDLGLLEFLFPAVAARKKPHLSGLIASPDPWVGSLLENPHRVELRYLKQDYSISIPQTGRFILAHGLQVRGGRNASPQRLFEASRHLLLLLCLLYQNRELFEEALNDLLDVRPASLIKELQGNLKENGPGSPIWENAQKSFLQTFSSTKGVDLFRWYWKLLPALQKVLEDQRVDGR